MNYLEIANSPVLFVIVLVPILWAVIQAVGFLRLAANEAKALDMPKSDVRKVIINSAIFSIVPTLPIIITLAVMMVILGRYIPWLRLSVMGSAAYESFAADLTIKAFGLEGGLGGAQLTPSVFVSIVWVMTLAIMVAPIENILFLKTYDKKLKTFKEKGGFMAIVSGALMIGMLSTLFVPELVNFGHPVGILVGVVSGVCAVLFDRIAKKTGAKALSQFSFPLSMLIGMAAAVLASSIGG
jgi:hypothetical protein